MSGFTNISDINRYNHVTGVRNIRDCKCSSDNIKTIYNGDYGSIQCRKCGKVSEGHMSFGELMDKWNRENEEEA